jgi:xanthine dehydrogenase YagS FAD-binding subunit
VKSISYVRTDSVPVALEAFRQAPDSLFLAGGTTVVDLLREGVFAPAGVVDINALPLRDIRVDGSFVTVGALVSNSELAWNRAVQALYPVVSEALLSGASGQIRNMATTGGNLLQRTRCPYYRDLSAGCNRRAPGSGCAALGGYNRSHAVLGGSERCVATHASDFAVALTALDAVLMLSGAEGERQVPITEFYLQPGDTPERETVLRPGELITAVRIPHPGPAEKSRYLKVRDRQSFEFALASAAVAVEIRNGSMTRVRIALGGVATVPWRARAAEKVLEGQVPSAGRIADAAEAALAGARPLPDNAFKIPLAKRVLAKALHSLVLPA